ncbi:hypothetical protein CCU_10710 [Coprococcus sp. ART55/1]|nr:hypothetical protein CCU_10710 [Coprococcus sp. ART55/1]
MTAMPYAADSSIYKNSLFVILRKMVTGIWH